MPETARDEITRRLDEMRDEQRDFRDEMRKNFGELPKTYLTKEVADERYKTVAERLAKLEGANTWLTRTVLALVIAAVIGVALATKLPMGH